MEQRAYEVISPLNRQVKIDVIPGHFATKHSHISHCIDMTRVKSEMRSAKAAARILAGRLSATPVETIISLDRMKMVGAFLAEELAGAGINAHRNITVISPEINGDKMILRDNCTGYVKNKHVLILMASATTGMTVDSVADGVKYYGGEVVGAAAIFGGDIKCSHEVISIFGTGDVPDYQSYSPQECPLCRAGVKVDAVVNSYGYSKISSQK